MARRVVGPDPHHPARERLLADELVETPVEHELDALLAGRELQGPGHGHPVADGGGPDIAARVVHRHRRERARALGIGDAGVLRRDRPRLHVGAVAQHQEAARRPRARQAAAVVPAADPRETDVVVHQELPGRRGVLGPRARDVPLVVAVRALGLGVEHRPVVEVREQDLDAVVELLRGLGRIDRDVAVAVALAPHVPALDRVAAAERDHRSAEQHPAAGVVVRIDHEHARPEVPRADGRGQPGAAGPRDDDIHLVVPRRVAGARGDALRVRPVRSQQGAGAQPGRGAGPYEIPARETVRVPASRFVRPGVVSLCHHAFS